VLVGRDALLAAGDAALANALRGRGRLLLLAGEAGIGKSTLAQAVADRGRAAGATVRTGACWETEGLPPFTPWFGVLRRPGRDACAEVAASLDRGSPDATDAPSARRARARLLNEVVDALYAVSVDQPQLIVLEDLHWADAASLELLGALAAHLASMSVLVVGTYRDDELPSGSPLASIGGRAEHLAVRGLDAAAVAMVLSDIRGRPAGSDEAAVLQAQTGGNPLFITQVARLLEAGSAGLPSGVQDVLERRLARVSTRCAEVLGAGAVLGHEFDQAPLGTMVGDDVLPALDEALAARLIVRDDDVPMRWRFVHALVQATRYAGLATAEREEWHQRAVHALRDRPDISAATLAHHATRGRFDRSDCLVADLLVAAGREALVRLAWADATTAFGRALAVAPGGAEGDEARAEAWLGIGAARLRQGGAEVRDAFDEAAALARRMGRPDLVARAALGFGVGLGAFEVRLVDHRQIDLLEEACLLLPESDPLLPLVLARLSVALSFVGSDDRRLGLATRAVDLARSSGQPVALGHALAARCDATAGPHHVADRLAAADEIITLGQRASDLPLELLGRRQRVVALFETNDFAEVDLEVTAYDRSAEALGDPLYSWYGHLWRAARAWCRGELAEADGQVRAAMTLGAQGGSQNSAILGQVHLLMTAIDRRDRTLVDAANQAMLDALPTTLAYYLWLTTAFLEAMLGDSDRVRAALQRVNAEGLAEFPRDSEFACSMAQLAAAAARVGDDARLELARGELDLVAGLGLVEGIGAYCHGSTHRFLALAAASLGDVEATRRHVDAAVADVVGAGILLEARTALDAAWALRRGGAEEDAERAGGLARSAAVAFTEVGLVGLAAEAESLANVGPVASVSAPGPGEAPTPTLTRQGDTWAWTWSGSSVNLRHAKGVADLAMLLERAGREVHIRELEGGAVVPTGGSHQPALDETAVHQYRQRLVELEDDLDEADRLGDAGQAAHLAEERDALVGELTRAFGLGGRARRAGSDPDERLRKAVSARVKATIERLDEVHPALGRHLRASVRTGFWCAYEPEQPTAWKVVR